MFSTTTVFLAFLGYMAILFGIAQVVERTPRVAAYLSSRPWVYALSITVYCTSWTFYGSVGLASREGLAYLPTYLGPTLMIGLWWVVLRKIVRIKEQRNITSIADFISARYDFIRSGLFLWHASCLYKEQKKYSNCFWRRNDDKSKIFSGHQVAP